MVGGLAFLFIFHFVFVLSLIWGGARGIGGPHDCQGPTADMCVAVVQRSLVTRSTFGESGVLVFESEGMVSVSEIEAPPWPRSTNKSFCPQETFRTKLTRLLFKYYVHQRAMSDSSAKSTAGTRRYAVVPESLTIISGTFIPTSKLDGTRRYPTVPGGTRR